MKQIKNNKNTNAFERNIKVVYRSVISNTRVTSRVTIEKEGVEDINNYNITLCFIIMTTIR